MKHYSRREEKQLLAIKRGKNQKRDLQVLAVAWGVEYPTLYAKWNTLHKNAGDISKDKRGVIKGISKRSPIPVVQAQHGKAVQPYVLEVGVPIPVRGDRASTIALKNTLRPILNAMEVRKHSVPIYKVNRGSVRKFLTQEFTDKIFTISPIPGNKNMVRIFRTK